MMSQELAKAPVLNRWKSVLIKCGGLILAVTLAVAAALTYLNVRSNLNVAKSGVINTAESVTELAASQTGGAIRFGKTDILSAVIADVIEGSAGLAGAGLFVTIDADVLAPSPNATSLDIEAMRVAGQTAMSTNGLAIQALPSGQDWIVAYPVHFGPANEIVGALAVQWTAQARLAEMSASFATAVAAGAGVLLAAMLCAMWLLQSTLARPMRDMAQSINAIAEGHYEGEVPQRNRQDEIGMIANALETCQGRLSDADKNRREGALKEAGFSGSSAPLTVLNETAQIEFANPAFLNLVGEKGLGIWDYGDDRVSGTDLSDLHTSLGPAAALAKTPESLPRDVEVRIGSALLELHMNRVEDADGMLIGVVVEWSNVTTARTNGAILEALETFQAKAAFGMDGNLSSANAHFNAFCDSDDPSAPLPQLEDMATILPDPENPGAPVPSVPEVMANAKPTFGTIQLDIAGKTSFLQGGICPVVDKSGDVSQFILLGADVTEARGAMERAGAEREAMQSAQNTMIDALRMGLEGLSDGDLMARLNDAFPEGYDGTREDFNQAAEILHDAIAAVVLQSLAIRTQVGEISRASDDLSRRTEQQAATLEQTAAALAEITSSVTMAAEGARRANEVVTEARENAESSGNVVEEAVAAMGQIEDSSSKISTIISVIDDIAFQTNLLALNAGVEAARAGDAGRGFAVVASEVRALAQRSSDAAKEINELISTSGGHVDHGVKLVGDAGDALKQIVDSVSGISEHVAAIAASADEQSSGLAEVNTAMSQLDAVTQQNAAMFQETTVASRALNRAAEELSTATARFTVDNAVVDTAASNDTVVSQAEARTTIDDHSDHDTDEDWEAASDDAFAASDATDGSDWSDETGPEPAPLSETRATGTDNMSSYDDENESWEDF